MTHDIYEFSLPLPITQGARRTAQQFASQQHNADKAEQVRLNTLAVLVMQDYFQLMDIPTDLPASDSWNPVMRATTDVADLELPGVGRLECRPVRPHAAACAVPPETWDDRVGYVVVQVNESSEEAQLLGFVPAAAAEDLPLVDLRSPEDLLDHLYDLKLAAIPANTVVTQLSGAVAATGRRLANLGEWLQGAIDEGWQTVESVLNPSQLSPAYAFRTRRTAVRQAQRIDLGSQAIALVVDVSSVTSNETEVRLQLHPTDGQNRLPNGIQLIVLDASGDRVIDAQSTGTEDFVELQIEGTPGERFSVQVALNNTRITQEFVI